MMSAEDSNMGVYPVTQQGLLDFLRQAANTNAQAPASVSASAPSSTSRSAETNFGSNAGSAKVPLTTAMPAADPIQAPLGDLHYSNAVASPLTPPAVLPAAINPNPRPTTSAGSSSSAENSPSTTPEQASPSSSSTNNVAYAGTANTWYGNAGDDSAQASWLGQEQHTRGHRQAQMPARQESASAASSNSGTCPTVFNSMGKSAPTPTAAGPAWSVSAPSMASRQQRDARALASADADSILRCPAKGCKKMYRRPSHLRRHMRAHKKKASFICPFSHCGRGFHRKDHYDYHIRVHTGEKPFVCDEEGCGRAFRQRSALNRHKKTHTRVRSLTCNYCRRVFANQQDLAVHMCASHPSELVQTLPAGTLRLGLLALTLGAQQRLRDEEHSLQQVPQQAAHGQQQQMQQQRQQPAMPSVVHPEFLVSQAPQHASDHPRTQGQQQIQQQPLQQHPFTPQPNEQAFISPLRFF